MLAECFHVTPDRRIARPILLDDPALGAGQIGLPGRAATVAFEIRDSIPHGNGIPARPRTPNGNVRQMRGFVVAEPCEQARNMVRRTSLRPSVRTICEFLLQLSDFADEQGQESDWSGAALRLPR